MHIVDYVVKVGFGTPATYVSLVMDTGSDLAWTQCKPCSRSQCYKQAEPIYNYTNSKSYSNILCKSPLCKNSTVNFLCAQNKVCIYQVLYADQTFSSGFFSKEKLTLSPSKVIKNFQFGCGQSNMFAGDVRVAGILGLGRGITSIVSQTAFEYNKVFSYCLPSSINTVGYLTFGKTDKVPPNTRFTPILTKPNWRIQFYFVQLVAVGVGGKKLTIDSGVFSKGTTIIDSGTTLTSLFPKVYAALGTAFQKAMSKHKYPKTQSYSLQLDTCYDLSKNKTVILPKISLLFKSGAELNVDPSGILVSPGNRKSQMCLAFVDSRNSNLGIIGSTQQKTHTVTYDVVGKRLGLTPGGCN
ncbi:aspartyl protease family protein At5g10770-like [Malania oleifera]|uniref:aspartyl protease family protein At5g10770-like n=1 Tax=Malania oleifera TaxID=397392 RepID=UPI0025ADFDCA|nr:aspartyl protease family protein At5g10770-like [Malania oleifera]